MRHHGYTSDPPLPEVQTANRQFAEAKKERKDAEKQRRDRKRKEKENREKKNRARAKEGKSPIATPESSPSAPGEIDYSMIDSSDTGVVGDQSPSRQQGSNEPSV